MMIGYTLFAFVCMILIIAFVILRYYPLFIPLSRLWDHWHAVEESEMINSTQNVLGNCVACEREVLHEADIMYCPNRLIYLMLIVQIDLFINLV
jgi:hypothetical protein